MTGPTGPREPGDFDAERRRILRRLSVLTWGVWAVVAVLAAVGGLVLAWLFPGAFGWSFPVRWVVGSIVLVAAPAAVQAVMGRRASRGEGPGDGS